MLTPPRMQLFEHLQGLSFIAYSSPDKAMDHLQVFDDGLVYQALKRILLCCSVSRRFWLLPLFTFTIWKLWAPFLCLTLSLLPFWQVTIRSSFSLVQQLLSSHGAMVCDPP